MPSARTFIRDEVDCGFLLTENGLNVIVNKFKEMRDGVFVHPLNKGAFITISFSLPFNRRGIEISVHSNCWRVELMLRSARFFSSEVLKSHFRVTRSVFEAMIHGVVDVSKVNKTDLFLGSFSLEFSTRYVYSNSISLFQNPINKSLMGKFASIIFLNTLNKPFLFR